MIKEKSVNCVEKKGVEWKQSTKSLDDALWFVRGAGQSYMRKTAW